MNEDLLRALPRPALDSADQERQRDQQNRRRQFDLDRITFQYVQDYRAGRPVSLQTYVQRYPQFARELREFALHFHCIGNDLPEPDLVPTGNLSAAARAALARIRAAISVSEQRSGGERVEHAREARQENLQDGSDEGEVDKPQSSIAGEPDGLEEV